MKKRYFIKRKDGLSLVDPIRIKFEDRMPWSWKKDTKAIEYLEIIKAAGHDCELCSMNEEEYCAQEQAAKRSEKKRVERILTEATNPHNPAPSDIFTPEDYENPEIIDTNILWTKHGINLYCKKCACRCKQNGASVIDYCPQYRAA